MTPVLIGRERPLAALADAIARAVAGRGSLVLVAGEAGIGKTSLLTAAAGSATPEAVVVAGSGWDGDGVPGYWPWMQVVRALERALPAEDRSRCVAAAGPAIERLLGNVATAVSGDESGFAVFDAVVTFVVTASRVTPLVVIVDDLHWADVASVRLLDFLVRQIGFESVAVLAAYRDDEIDDRNHPLRTLVHSLNTIATTVPLRGLSADDVGRLIRDELGSVAPDVAAAMHQRTGGNPFFVKQTAQLWSFTGSSGSIAAGVRDAVERRLARLPSSSMPVLSMAALAGTVFNAGALSTALGCATTDVLDALAPAASANLVVVGDRGLCRFVHDVVRETLVAAMTPADARPSHAALFRALAPDASVAPARTASHAYLADGEVEVGVAIEWLQTAARDARRRGAADEAAMQLERALERARDQPRWPEIALDLGGAQQRAGSLAEAGRTFAAVVTEARRRSHGVWLAKAVLGLHELGHSLADDPGPDLALFDEALETLAQGDADETALRARVTAASSRSRSHVLGADRDVSESLSATAVELARTSGEDDALAFCLLARHDAIWKPGTAPERLRVAGEMVAAARRSGNVEAELQAMLLRVVAWLELGDRRGYEEFQAYRELAEHTRLPRARYVALSRQGTIAVLRGDFDAARQHIDAAKEMADEIGEVDAVGVWADQRWEAARLQGHVEEMRRVAEVVRDDDDSHYLVLRTIVDFEAGDIAVALAGRAELRGLGERWPRWGELLWLTFRVDLAVAADDYDELVALRDEIAAVADTWAVLGGAVIVHGPMAFWAGRVCAALGETDAAIDYFEQARAAADALDARPWWVLSTAHLSCAVAQRAGPDDATWAAALSAEANHQAGLFGMNSVAALVSAVSPTAASSTSGASQAAAFRKDGDVWVLTFGGRTVIVPNSKGLQDLHVLLGRPGVGVASVELVDPALEAVEARAARRLGGDLVLDEEAKRAYKRRLGVLDDEIAAALDRNADAAAARLEEERSMLIDQLRVATGLGGRSRRLGDEAEKARKTVAARIRDTLRRLEGRHPELAAHLHATVTTGAFCVYQHDAALDWKL